MTKVDPVYPWLVGRMRIQGTVKYDVLILADGTIGQLTIKSGPKPLQEAATEALRQWVFKPTLVNGEPVEVSTQIEIEVRPAEAHAM
ncbi:MAG: energy transducer TonB [Bryobacteraceae bacterium]|jgi:protein TonB